MNCEQCQELLSEFEAGELTEEQAANVHKHVEQCNECSELLKAIEVSTELVCELADEEPSRAMSLRVLGKVDEMLAPDLTDAPDILTPELLAKFLGISLEQLEDDIHLIPGFEIAGNLRFRKERVIEWIEERERDRERQRLYRQIKAV